MKGSIYKFDNSNDELESFKKEKKILKIGMEHLILGTLNLSDEDERFKVQIQFKNLVTKQKVMEKS